ncbi:hypothetical protein F5884DRAFT_359493 [Xylogone sp. PMI_703]|nr:hypothetical protein F5884DRAFT_359493 [Xylogone sp. PMI_703]
MAQPDPGRDNAHNMRDDETNTTDANALSRGRDKPLFKSRKLDAGQSPLQKDNGESKLPRPTGGGWMSGRTSSGSGLRAAYERAGRDTESASPSPSLRRSCRDSLDSTGSVGRSPQPAKSYMRETVSSTLRTYANGHTPEEKSASAHKEGDAKHRLHTSSPSPLPRPRGRSNTGDGNKLQTSTRRSLHFPRKSEPFRRKSGGIDEDEDNQSMISSGRSSLSGFSLLEDSTEDEFDRKMIKYLKDQERYTAATSSRNGLFSRTDSGNKDAEREDSKKPTSTKNDDEPPVRVPSTWGSKAKRNDGWLSKIISPEGSLDGKSPTSPNREGHASNDVPLPSIEDQQALQEFTPPASRPTSTNPSSATPEKSNMWDADLDFTAHSLQASTPHFTGRKTKLDEVREAEFQSLLPRAVAQSRLEDIRERNSEERSLSPEAERTITNAPGRNQSELLHERTILEEEGEPIPGTPITIFSGGSRPRTGDAKPAGGGEESKDAGNSEERKDQYRDTLRSLSRLASSSVSPSPSQEDKPAEKDKNADKEKSASKQTEGLAADPPVSDAEKKRHSTISMKSDTDPEVRIVQEKKLFDLPDGESEKNSIRTMTPPPLDNDELETPRPGKNALTMPTPKVTGAYIETPAPTVQRTSTSESSDLKIKEESDEENLYKEARAQQPSNKELQRNTERPSSSRSSKSDATVRQRSRPPLINTARPASISEDLKSIRKEIDIDDSTLDDFDAIIEAHGNGVPDDTTILENIVDLEYDQAGRPLSQKEKDRRLELLTLQRMNRTLKNTSTSITEAKRGIERLEKTVSASTIAAATAHKHDTHHNHANCPDCTVNDSVYHLVVPVPRLLKPKRHENERRRLTWLGLITLVFSIWYVSESVMCEYYCHPTYSSRNTWSPSDPFFPYAIPTKLDQWTGEVVSGAMGKVSDAIWNAWTEGKKPNYNRSSAAHINHGHWMGNQKHVEKSYIKSDDGWEDITESSMFEDERI